MRFYASSRRGMSSFRVKNYTQPTISTSKDYNIIQKTSSCLLDIHVMNKIRQRQSYGDISTLLQPEVLPHTPPTHIHKLRLCARSVIIFNASCARLLAQKLGLA